MNTILDEEILKNSKELEEIVEMIIKPYIEPLDKIMKTCNNIFNSSKNISNIELEDLLAQLPGILYFVNEGLEKIGIRQDIAEITKKNNYNNARMQASGTIADKNAFAENVVTKETLNKIIYERSYKLIKSKIELGQEMINSLKRIFDSRMMDMQISRGVRK